MCALLAPEQLDGFYSYSVFKSLSTTGRCQENMKILATKIWAIRFTWTILIKFQ
jgi:hypothetical protein